MPFAHASGFQPHPTPQNVDHQAYRKISLPHDRLASSAQTILQDRLYRAALALRQ